MNLTTIETYNRKFKEYDQETTSFWNQFPPEMIDKFVEYLPGDTVLNVGSGPNRDGVLLTQRGVTITCLDASQSMTGITKSQGYPSIEADFLKMPLKKGSFAGVWAYTSLIHVPKKEISTALFEARKLLKFDGVIGLGFIEGDFEGCTSSSKVLMPRYFAYYRSPELIELIHLSGFEILFFDRFQPREKVFLNIIARRCP